MYKKLLGLFVSLFVLVAGMSNVQAAVLDFDDISFNSNYVSMPAGYGGFSWTQAGALNATQPTYASTGYRSGLVSGTNVAFNWDANDLTISSASAFDFNNAYLTAAWSNGLNIDVIGSLNSNPVYSSTITVGTAAANLFNFDYQNIDTLSFHAYGGSDSRSHFAMDNFVYNEAPVPEPSTAILGLLGLGGLLRARRKK